MAIDADFMRVLRKTFQVELDEQLQQITDGLLALEKKPGREELLEIFNSIFRCAHNIKGAARGVGANNIEAISHRLESLFSNLRHEKSTIDAGVIDLCLEALDSIRAITATDLDDSAELDSAETDNPIFARLDRAIIAASPEQQTATAPPSGDRGASQPETPQRDDGGTGSDRVTAEANTESESPPAPSQQSNKSVGGGDSIRVSLEKLQRLSSLAEELQVAKISIDDHFEKLLEVSQQIHKLDSISSHSAEPVTAQISDRQDTNNLYFTKTTARFDGLRAQASQLSKAMRATKNRMGFISAALQDEIRMTRLLPAATILQPMHRIVRDLARELGKEVELTIQGDQIEIDRAVLEGIRDPLIHLVRNAIDHGLESSADRAAAGKAENAAITLSVESAGGQIRISIADNGRGIDTQRVADIALKKQLISQDKLEHMDELGKMELIFLPGFSSAEIITDVSGRGVGLDVVKANLRKLNGSVEVDSQPGAGTTFRLLVPLSLTTERGLQVSAGGECLVIPSTAVERIMELSPDDVIDIAASQAILLDDTPIPLRSLADILSLPLENTDRRSTIPVVIVSKGAATIAVVVDEVVGEREIVIKRLLPPLSTVPNISGATLTGSGEIMMVLNVADLVESSQQRSSLDYMKIDSDPVEAATPAHILVVDDSITTRMLEKTILETHGFRVTVATDGKQGWELFQKEKFDLVVTDIEMPTMNGFELTERIKQHQHYSDVPVIIVTSLSKEEDKKRGVEVGANAYIVKSQFETRALVDVVQRLIID